MKIHVTTSVLALTAALFSSAFTPVFAATSTLLPFAYRVKDTDTPRNTRIARGDNQWKVLGAMGDPIKKLSHNVWVYHGYQADDLALANKQDCHFMLVTFDDGKVMDLTLVNPAAAEEIAAKLKANPKLVFEVKK